MSIDLVQVLKDDISSISSINFQDLKLIRVQFFKKTNKLKVFIKTENPIDSFEESELKKIIYNRLGCFENMELIRFKDISNATLQDISEKYWIDVTNNVVRTLPIAKQFLLNSFREIDRDTIKISHGNNFICKLLKSKNIEVTLKNCINDLFGLSCKIDVSYNNLHKDDKLDESCRLKEKSIIQDVMKEIKPSFDVVHKEIKPKNIEYNHSFKNESNILGRNISEDSVTIDTVDQTSGNVIICGEIFKTEIIETKTGRKIITFFITDYTSSIAVKFFPKPKDTDKVLEEIKNGLFCKVKGEASYDSYSREVVISPRDIVKMKKIERMDICEEKRVELHLHTTMSSMDAISSPSKLIERASKWGHTAIAITDHGVVQAYPEAMDAAKKYNIKVIYGVEAYLVDDGVPIVLNGEGFTVDNDFVVCDIETTGLSCNHDKIIEIAAIKICNKKIVDQFSFFINPKMPIPAKITELTGINNDMLKDAESITSIIQLFKTFIGESILVAHNAQFDVSFIKKAYNDLGLEFNNPIMDTIPLAKFIFPELKRFKLDAVAKYLGLSIKNRHRAIGDARVTAEILLCCFDKLKEKEISKLSDLNEEYIRNQDIKKLPTFHLIILVKNQIGLKNLYKLISMSHLDYFQKRPRMPKSLINKYREGLIFGSACEAGQIYRDILQGKTDEELKEVIDFYDYLEIQPVDNNEFMVRNGIVKDKTEIMNINSRICTLGDSNYKPVVATCDVHFLDQVDATYRKIIMAGQGFSDADQQAPLYLRTTNEMLKEFAYLGEAKAKEVVIYNTNKIANMIEAVKPIPDETYTPKIDGAEDDIRNMTMDKAHSIYGDVLPEVVQKRLDKELNSIINHGYAVLYLIAQKLVAKSLQDGYLVGSRGSVGSSFVATMSGITEVNGLPPHYVCENCKHSEFILDGSISSGADLPDKVCPNCNTEYTKDGHDIPFETFLGFEGDKEPDIDLNFSGDYQAIVHKYTEVLFGKGFVFKAGTIGTIAEKTAYGYVLKYLQERNMVVTRAEIERLTLGCTGIKRTTGQHPGGIMVVPRDNDILNFTPIQHPADDNSSDIITTHFDYHSISGRLLKLDILGHDDPTVLRMLQDITGLDPKSIPLNDVKVISLFTSPDALGITSEDLNCEVGTYGLPEFGTKFVRQMLLDTKPRNFADLVRISGLSHGTNVWLNNAQYYIKEGLTTLKDCISTRDDIMVYLMYKGLLPKIAFNIMEKVRKGKGLNEDDITTMKENKVPDWYIESCNKIKYMFPKGHAVAYVMMAVRIAFFKVYYPKAYYATYFTVRADDFDADLIEKGDLVIKQKMDELNKMGNNITQKDKGLLTILEIAFEMNKRNILLLKVDIYKSHPLKFVIEADGILPPLKSLQGVGENAAKSIAEARIAGEFISKEDLRNRSKITKTAIETLEKHGCLNGLPETNQLTLF